MPEREWESSADRMHGLALQALARPQSPHRTLPKRLVVVDVDHQRLGLLMDGDPAADYPISTARAGVGGEVGSLRTPEGWHRVHARIGAGEPLGAVFESRIPTGKVWRGEGVDDDLILTRILTLEGLEDGVNRGPGCDSLERYIYIHGTNHEGDLGRPASHGCVRMANADVVDLFDRVETGDAVVLVAGGVSIPDPSAGRFHYAGVAGSGMSALAQFQVMTGGRASGSDRAFDRGERGHARALLERLGIAIVPQDGTGVAGDCGALVQSTAVENQVPDMRAARDLGIPVIHRSELLAHFVAAHRTVAVAGTSGKSTVVAMIFEILRGDGRSPSVITGGDLLLLQAEGLWGNAWFGGGDLLVVEADESDGSLVRYRPAISLILNLERDHRETREVGEMFTVLARQTRETRIIGEGEPVAFLAEGATVFGLGPGAHVRATAVELGPQSSQFEVDGVRFRLPLAGRYNVENAVAAIAACRALDVELPSMVRPLAEFRGVARRFQSLGTARGIEVIDDFAHNPAKLRASIETAHYRLEVTAERERRASPGRLLAVYQPHGYGPTRFLRSQFVDTFSGLLRQEDRLWLLEIYYAGGTAVRDFSSADIVAEIAARGTLAEFAASREGLIDRLATEARGGDIILIMGARDSTLTDLGVAVLAAIESHAPRLSGASGERSR